MGGRQARRLCPRAVVVAAAHVGLQRGEQGGVRGVRATRRRWSRGCRSTRRSSTSAGCGGSPGRPTEIAVRLRARGAGARSACRSPSGVARTKFLAKVASGVAKPDGLLVVPPDGELDFLHPLRSSGCGASGPSRRAKLREPRDHDRRRGRGAARGGAGRRCSAQAPGRHLHALAHNRDPRPVQVGRRRRLDRRAARARAPAAAAGRSSTRSSSALVDRVTRRLRTAPAGRPYGRAAAALRRLLPRDPIAHAAAGRPPRPTAILGARARPAPAARPD